MRNFSLFMLMIFGDVVLSFQDTRQCGKYLAGSKIVGGVDSGGYHYPWFALLLLKKNSYVPIPVCGGSLITRYHVLTAAHCFTINPSIPNKDLYDVALGVYDICDNKEDTRRIFRVADVAIHEMYQKKGKFFDIALIKLNRPADNMVICLPLSGVPDVTEPAFLIGFGATDENSEAVPCHMMEVNVTKYSSYDCSKTKLPLEDKKEPSVICAGSLKGDVDSCYGDSGGPLQTIDHIGRYTIAGIVSYGYGCAVPEIPGIYTNVGSYLDWIKQKITQSGNKSHQPTQPKSFHQKDTHSSTWHKSVSFPRDTNNDFSKTRQSSTTFFQVLNKPVMITANVTSFTENNEQSKSKSKVRFPN